MAAFAQTTTLDQRLPSKMASQPGNKILSGLINITNYNTTTVEITDITKYFKTTPRVVLSGVSSLGYLVTWVPATKTVKAWYPTNAITSGTYVTSVAAPGTEVANDVNVGTVNFIAIGV